ncbi:MAG TPA: hypothetical protein VFE34_10265 [Dongiaceae bacterium]|jgi:hypothetical protein|nr:hypothetical protein [Dongiaceae bacterium]
MANKNDLFDFDETTALNNDNVQGANIAENCAPSGINNAIRGLASIIKRALGSQGSAIASAATTAIGAAGTALYTTVTGTTAITSFGTVGAGTLRIIEFTGALVLTHNATSLKLPGSANITTAAGDVGFFLSLGSGNWKCLHFSRADGAAVASFSGTLTSTDPGAGGGPHFLSDRNSASPAASDVIGGFISRGRNSVGNPIDYVYLLGIIGDATNGSEDGIGQLRARIAGVDTAVMQFGPGVQVGSPSGGDKGLASLNAQGVYIGGHGTIAQVVTDIENTYTTLGTILPFDNSIPQNTEGDEILSVAITPVNASSTLLIMFSGNFGGSTGQEIGAALFVDSTANALNASSCFVTAAGIAATNTMIHVLPAGSTSTRTYRIRAGSEVATDGFLNGDSASRKFGGASAASLVVMEILPQ